MGKHRNRNHQFYDHRLGAFLLIKAVNKIKDLADWEDEPIVDTKPKPPMAEELPPKFAMNCAKIENRCHFSCHHKGLGSALFRADLLILFVISVLVPLLPQNSNARSDNEHNTGK